MTLTRTTALVCLLLALGALVMRPDKPRLAGGVLGGGLLVGLAIWAIAGLVDHALTVDHALATTARKAGA